MTEKKMHILTEALRLFSERGYEAVSVDEIAAAAGIKAPSLYHHFRSKRAIFDAILAEMARMDGEFAAGFDLPADLYENMPDAYRAVTPAQIVSFSKAMLRHWTTDPFSCRFRRLLTVEQYRDPEMARLYQQYLASGPVGYLTDLFRFKTDRAAEYAAIFYGTMHLLYSMYDESGEAVLDAGDRWLDALMTGWFPYDEGSAP